MPKKKRIGLLLLLAVAIFGGVIILVRHGQGQTSPTMGTRMKALRSKGQLHVKPTAAEIASNKNKFQDPPPSTPKEERELDDQIPRHLPIKIKLRKEKEKAFKDLDNEKWLRDLEVEVTNTGDKSIYFIDLLLILPEVRAQSGNNMGFPLYYGKSKFGNLETKAGPDDIPIRLGDTYVFKIIENQVLGWDAFRRKHKWPQPKKLILHFRILSFGDGTGFMGNTGLFFPRSQKEISSACTDPPGRGNSTVFDWQRPRRLEIGRDKTVTTPLPASPPPMSVGLHSGLGRHTL